VARRRLPEGIVGIAGLHAMVAERMGRSGSADEGRDDEGIVVVGIETDRGPWVEALIAAGYQVYAINPKQASRFKERYGVSGAKAIRATHTRWRTWSGSTGTRCARSLVTRRRLRRSRSSPGRKPN
jgi:transposase